MCGRYYLKSPPADVAALFGVDVRDNFPPRYNIAPTQPIAVIRNDARGRREYALVRWGFAPAWARKIEGRPLINARSETVAEKPTFRAAYRRRRCLIPADGFYEWTGAAEAGRARRAHCIRRAAAGGAPAGGLFAFAGVWETVTDPDGGEIDTAAILTAAAGPDLKALHHREPVYIAPARHALWLDADERDIAQLAALTAPSRAGDWTHHEVSALVNSVRNDGPELIAPDGDLPLFS